MAISRECFFCSAGRVNLNVLALGAAASLVLLLLEGCGARYVRLETSGEVVKATTAAVEKSKSALAAAKESRIEANAIFVASDPSCPASPTILIYTIRQSQAKGAPLCAANENAALEGYAIKRVRLDGVPDESLAIFVAMIGAMTDYAAAYNKILESPNANISAEIDGVVEKAKVASGLAAILGASTLASGVDAAIGQFAGEQAKTAIDILQFIADLAVEGKKNDEIKQIMNAKGQEFDAIVEKLHSQLDQWLDVQNGSDLRLIQSRLAAAYDLERASRNSSFPDRLPLARRTFEAQTAIESADARRAALKKALSEVAEAHKELRAEFEGHFSEEKKREVAKKNRERFWHAAGLLAAAAAKYGIGI